MDRGRPWAGVLVSLLLIGTVCPTAGSDERDRGPTARTALERGLAQPVQLLLQRVRAGFAGTVLKVELEQDDDDDGDPPWIYEVKLLTPRGDVLELEYDAGTLELLELEGRYRELEDD